MPSIKMSERELNATISGIKIATWLAKTFGDIPEVLKNELDESFTVLEPNEGGLLAWKILQTLEYEKKQEENTDEE